MRELEAIHQLAKAMFIFVMHTACSPNASGLEMLLGISNLGKRITTARVV
jgi:hypothetical protein